MWTARLVGGLLASRFEISRREIHQHEIRRKWFHLIFIDSNDATRRLANESEIQDFVARPCAAFCVQELIQNRRPRLFVVDGVSELGRPAQNSDADRSRWFGERDRPAAK